MADADLADLDSFAAVARARSFRVAAAQRGMSASALSEAVRRLERRVGVRLLNRTTRSVTPTEPGLRLMEQLGPALGAVRAALDVVNGFRETPRGTLRLNVPTIVASRVLPAIVTAFLQQYPEITVEIATEDRFVDVLADGFDAGVRYDERLAQDMIAIPLGPLTQHFAVGGAPSYLAAHGCPAHPRDLVRHKCIRHRFQSGFTVPWELSNGDETVRVDVSGPLVATSIELEVAAAEAGLGLIGTFDDFLRPSFESGHLVPVLEDWWETFTGPRLYFFGNRLVPAPLRAFIDFLKGWSDSPTDPRQEMSVLPGATERAGA